MNVLRKQSGFTLIEVIVVAGIIAVLAGILVPIIFKEIDESKKTRAAADVKSVSSAIMVLKKDTGSWPIATNCSAGITMLSGAGNIPAFVGVGWDASARDSYENYISRDDNGCWPNIWKGPYMATVNADAWGRAYVTNAADFLTTNPVWIISAGPDGNVDTGTADSAPAGDDIGVRLQ